MNPFPEPQDTCPVMQDIFRRHILGLLESTPFDTTIVDPHNAICCAVYPPPAEDVDPHDEEDVNLTEEDYVPSLGCNCRDCGEDFSPRRGPFGKDICADCFRYFIPSKQRKDIKQEFLTKDITVADPFLCGLCSCIVHEENGLCTDCARICDIYEDDYYNGYDDGIDLYNCFDDDEKYEKDSCCSNCDFDGFNVGYCR